MSLSLSHSSAFTDSLVKATLAIAGAETLDAVLQQIVDSARQLTGAQYGAIGISDDKVLLNAPVLSMNASSSPAGPPTSSDGMALLEALLRQAHGGRRVVDSGSGEGEHAPRARQATNSFLAIPIVSGDMELGNLYLTNKDGGAAFSQEDQELVQMLAAHAAVAIRKATLLQARTRFGQQLERRNRQLAALNQATMAISGELTLDKVLQQIVDSARELSGSQYAALGVPKNEGGLDTFVHSGMAPDEADLIGHYPKGLGLLGAIIREKRSIRLAKLADDPRSVGFPAGHPPMTSFMGVPVTTRGHVLGNLYLTNKLGADEFTSEDQEFVEMLAAHAAIVIQNSRLYEQVGRLAVIAERARIGMDLHDGVIQSIYAVGLNLESVKLTLDPGDDEVNELLNRAIDGLNNTIGDIRNFILDLRPHRFSGDLGQAMARLVREFQANSVIPVSLDMARGLGSKLPSAVSRAIFLTTQEALANIARHAKASAVSITAGAVGSSVQLTIIDDGQGFDTRLQVQTVGHGLSNMRARAETLKGTFSLASSPGAGTTVSLKIPLK
jgi:signal transduction histidine kinase